MLKIRASAGDSLIIWLFQNSAFWAVRNLRPIIILSIIFFLFFAPDVFSSNIDGTYKWAWSDNIGWLDFGTPGVTVKSLELIGSASSSVGIISMNCSNQNSCNSSNYKVNNDGEGHLSGWAWNQNIGWISFCGNASSPSTWDGSKWACPSSPTYRVFIENKEFFGWAWSPNIGWISFNCSQGGCATGGGCSGLCGDWKVKTDWTTVATTTGDIISPIYDSQIAGGIAFNTLRWLGVKPTNTEVWFQVASSRCPNGATNPPSCNQNVGWGGTKNSGSGAFVGPSGTAGESGSHWYRTDPNVWVKIDGPGSGSDGCMYDNFPCHNNSRYFRYRMRLVSLRRGSSPRVDDVMLSWSP